MRRALRELRLPAGRCSPSVTPDRTSDRNPVDTRVRLAALSTTNMIALSALLPRRAVRPLTLVIAPAFALSIIGGAVGEMGYYVLGSALELLLLVVVLVIGVRWLAPQVS